MLQAVRRQAGGRQEAGRRQAGGGQAGGGQEAGRRQAGTLLQAAAAAAAFRCSDCGINQYCCINTTIYGNILKLVYHIPLVYV